MLDAVQSSSKALTHGLEVLRLLSVSPRPVTSTELAKKLGLHQSTVSRILKILSKAGYVRKPDYHSFAPDYGILSLAGIAAESFTLTTKPRKAVTELAERCNGLLVQLATLWRGDLIYFLRTHKGHDPLLASATGYPLHLSSVALRLLIDRPQEEALNVLEESKRRYGWIRPAEIVPDSPGAVLDYARQHLRDDALVLRDYQRPGWLSASICVRAAGEPPFCLALSGASSLMDDALIYERLKEGRKAIEEALK